MEDSKEIIKLSDNAAAKVREIISSEGLPEDSIVRVGVQGGGCAGFQYLMSLDTGQPRPTDTVVKTKGVTIYIDQMSLMYMSGTEITYLESLQATGFKFNNPLTSGSCGCGNSFSV